MSNSNFYQSGPGSLDTNNPTVIPNSFDGVMTADGGVSNLSPAQQVAAFGRVPGTLALTLTGTVTDADIVSISVVSPALPSGAVAVQVTAASSDSLTNVAQKLANAINQNAVLQQFDFYATSLAAVVTIYQLGPCSALTTVSDTSNPANSEVITFSNQSTNTVVVGGSVPADKWTALIAGSATEADVITLRFTAVGLPSGHKDVSITAPTTPTLAALASSMRTAINADTDLSGLSITCPSITTSTTLNISSAGPVYMSALTYTQGSNTETFTIVHVTRETIVLRFSNADFPSGHIDISYLVVNGNTLAVIAAALTLAVQLNATLNNAGITAAVSNATVTVHQSGPDFATLSNQTSGSPGETLTISDPAGTLAGGSGVAVPMNNFNVMVNGTLLRLRYGIPVRLPPAQLRAACAAGPVK